MPRATVSKKAAFLVDLVGAPDADLMELRDYCSAILASRKAKAPKAARAQKTGKSPITEAAEKATQRRPRGHAPKVPASAGSEEIIQ